MGEGGCTNACICMGTYSQPLQHSCLMDVYEMRDEVLMAAHMG